MIRRPPRSTLFPLHDALPIFQRRRVRRGNGDHRSRATDRRNHRREGDPRGRRQIGRAHLLTPVTSLYRMPTSSCKKKKVTTVILYFMAAQVIISGYHEVTETD